jgi:hypothetical protein
VDALEKKYPKLIGAPNYLIHVPGKSTVTERFEYPGALNKMLNILIDALPKYKQHHLENTPARCPFAGQGTIDNGVIKAILKDKKLLKRVRASSVDFDRNLDRYKKAKVLNLD